MRVVDTEVVIELLRGNQQVLERRQAAVGAFATTWVTAAELYYGAAKSRSPLSNRVLVTDFLATLDVLGLDLPASQRFGELKADLESRGERLADADLMIASITLAVGGVLITGNLRHYSRISGLQIEDWLRAPGSTS